MYVFFSKVLRPIEVTLNSGDALVWFPGWEHETIIVKGVSVNLRITSFYWVTAS